MAYPFAPRLSGETIQGFKYFNALGNLLTPLHEVGTERDKAGNRKLFFDQYAGLILLYFFSPVLTSLRGIQQASGLRKVQRLLGKQKASLGSLSEASSVFDAEVLQGVIQELGARVTVPGVAPSDLSKIATLTAVDGSLLPALPQMVWALWLDEEHRAVKMHLAFEVLRGIPVQVRVTEGNAKETDQLRLMVGAERLYVVDRGYAEYKLFQDVVDAGSSVIARIRDNAVWTELGSRPLSEQDKAAGIRRDLIVELGGPQSGKVLKQALRVIAVETGKLDKHGQPEVLLLATDRMDLSAHLIATAYRYRWSVELFFRWFKCILGCRHLLSTSHNGVKIQVYMAIIASLLIVLWTQHKPTKRTFEILGLYFMGLADADEVIGHIDKLGTKQGASP